MRVNAHIRWHQNVLSLGDYAVYEMIAQRWPDLEEDSTSQNLLITAEDGFVDLEKFEKAQEITLFGCGAKSPDALPSNDRRILAYPRGRMSEAWLTQRGIRTGPIVGDASFLLAHHNTVAHDPNGQVIAVIEGLDGNSIALGNIKITTTMVQQAIDVPVVISLSDWRSRITAAKAVVAATVRPVILAIASGIPARMPMMTNAGTEVSDLLNWDLTIMPTIEQVQTLRGQMQALADQWNKVFAKALADQMAIF